MLSVKLPNHKAHHDRSRLSTPYHFPGPHLEGITNFPSREAHPSRILLGILSLFTLDRKAAGGLTRPAELEKNRNCVETAWCPSYTSFNCRRLYWGFPGCESCKWNIRAYPLEVRQIRRSVVRRSRAALPLLVLRLITSYNRSGVLDPATANFTGCRLNPHPLPRPRKIGKEASHMSRTRIPLVKLYPPREPTQTKLRWTKP